MAYFLQFKQKNQNQLFIKANVWMLSLIAVFFLDQIPKVAKQ